MADSSMSAILSRIDRRLAALAPEGKEKLSDRDASLRSGLSADGIRSIRRQLVAGRQNGLRSTTLDKLAAGLETTYNWLLTGEGPEEADADQKTVESAKRLIQEVIPAPDRESPLDRLGPATLPILGITMGGRSDKRGPDFWMNGEIIRYAPRPRRLEGQKDVFGLYVDGSSMEPRYHAKDLVVVEKTTPAPGDDVVIELKSSNPTDDNDNPSFIKQFVSRRGSTITVKQFNPKKELTFDLKEIKNLFRVIPLKELMS